MVTLEVIVSDARDWLTDCGADTRGRSDRTILREVRYQWDGGLIGFCRTMYGRRWATVAYHLALSAIN